MKDDYDITSTDFDHRPTSRVKSALKHLRGLSDIAFYGIEGDSSYSHEQRQEQQLRIDEHFDYLHEALQNLSPSRVKWVTREADPQEVVELRFQMKMLEGKISADATTVAEAERKIFEAGKKAQEAEAKAKFAQEQAEFIRQQNRNIETNLSKARERAGELLLRVEELEAQVADLTRKQNVEIGDRKLKLES